MPVTFEVRAALAALLLFTSVVFAADAEDEAWRPPEKPKPWTILNEAFKDVTAKKYDLALAKHLWYHRHAEEFDGVGKSYRFTMALRTWHELGKKHPPALKALHGCRDEALAKFNRDEGIKAAFHEYAEINRELKQDELTVQAYREFHERDSRRAAELMRDLPNVLLAAGEYEYYGKYVKAGPARGHIISFYKNQHFSAERNPDHKEARLKSAEDILSHDASRLVACLMIAGRDEEAKAAAELFGKESDSAQLKAALENGLKGIVPPRFGAPQKAEAP